MRIVATGKTIARMSALMACLVVTWELQVSAAESTETSKPSNTDAAKPANVNTPKPPTSQPVPEPEKKQLKVQSPEVVIKVLDRGAEPRKALRYKFVPGKKNTMVTDMKMSMTIEMAGLRQPEMNMPAVRTIMSIDNKEVAPDGSLRYDFKLTGVEVLPDQNSPPDMATTMDAAMKKLIGINGFAVTSNRGVIKEASVEFPSVASQQMQQIVKDIQQLAVPLPEEAVGKGAKWEVRMPISMWSLTLTQIVTYTLEEIKGDTGKFAVAIEMAAPPQKMESPNMPADTEMYLEYLKTASSGVVEFNLGRLVPVSTIKGDTSMSMNIVAPKAQQVIRSTLTMETTIAPK